MNEIFDDITGKTKFFALITEDAGYSLSPRMQNAAFRASGTSDQYRYIGFSVSPENLEAAVTGLKGLGMLGASIGVPHKQKVIKLLDDTDEVAKRIGAVNTILNKDGRLIGTNTDWEGILTPLKKVISLKDKNVALVGAGGAARAALYGISLEGANVTVFNRTIDKAAELARDFDCNFKPLNELEQAKGVDIFINVTKLGMHKEDDLPIPLSLVKHGNIVFDAVYVRNETTRLVQSLKVRDDVIVIPGLEMLLYQGIAQFELFTGLKAPEQAMREVIGLGD